MITNKDIALAHDSFTQYGGAERVIEALHDMYPQSEVHTIVADSEFRKKLIGWKIRPTILQYVYNVWPHFLFLFPFIPFFLLIRPAIRERVVISSSSAFAKCFKVKRGSIHINYCHTPTRFLWSGEEFSLQELPAFSRPLALWYFKLLRIWDKAEAQKVTHFIANSKEVQQRIKTYYNRDSQIIYPFIDVEFWKPTVGKSDNFLIAGRLQRAKNLEVVVRTFNQNGLPLRVVGTGRFESFLRSIAKPNIIFLGRVSDAQLRDEYSMARGYIYPQIEDFGLMPLEAAACGTATIGLAEGGSLETIVPGKTGELLTNMNEQTLTQAVVAWNERKYLAETLRQHGLQYSRQRFQKEMISFVEKVTGHL